MNIPRPRRFLLRTGAAAALIGALLGAPAQAAPEISVQISPHLIVSTPGESFFDITVNATGVTNPQVTIRPDTVASIATVRLFDPAGAIPCGLSWNYVTCNVPSNATSVLRIGITPLATPSATAVSQQLSYHASGDSVSWGSNVPVTIVDGGLLAVSEGSWAVLDTTPGSTVSPTVVFHNVGNKAANGVSVVTHVTKGLVPKQYKNCSYGVSPDGLWTAMRCSLPISVAAGSYFSVQNLAAVVAPFGMGGLRFSGGIYVLGQEYAPEPGYVFTPGTGDEQLVAVPWSGTPTSNTADAWFDTQFNVSNVRDLATVGAVVNGVLGAEVDIRIGAQNVGPGALQSFGSGGEYVTRFHFEVPAWATVVAHPENCWSPEVRTDGTYNWGASYPSTPGQRHYDCFGEAEYLGPGESDLVTFRLRITALTGANGITSFTSPVQPDWSDDNPANDNAQVTLAPVKAPPPRVIPTWPPGGGKPPIRP